ncbi:MAG: rubredoxin, partial [Methanobacterium paludis]|nr:rubredoxin [Methanobacterium paludis]
MIQIEYSQSLIDPEVGDSRRGINPGTPFEELPDNWSC